MAYLEVIRFPDRVPDVLKLLRVALTTAVVAAIAVRLRRRARLPRPSAPPPRPHTSRRSVGPVLLWAAIAAPVAVTLALALSAPSRDRGEPAAAPLPQPDPGTSAVAAEILPTPASTPTPRADPACAPSPRPVTVRPIDPGVRRAVNRQWRRIERWLRANEPRTYRSLGPRGSARRIAIAESQMGLTFPDDLRASLLRHDGALRFSFGLAENRGRHSRNLSTREIRDAWRAMCGDHDVLEEEGDRKSAYWSGRLIPYLDYDAEETGRPYGRVDSVSAEVVGGVAAISYLDLMRATADALEKGAGR